MSGTLVSHHSQSATVSGTTWLEVDAELSAMLFPVHSLLSSDSISPTEAGESFASILFFQLMRHGVINSATQALGPHRERGLVTLTKRLSRLKNSIRSDKGVSKQFLTAVRVHNRVLRTPRQVSQNTLIRRKEKAFRSNPWSFSKQVCGSSNRVSTLFSSEVVFKHFSSSFSAFNFRI